MRRLMLMSLALLAGLALVLTGRSPDHSSANPSRTAIHSARLFDGTNVTANATVVFDESGIISICSDCRPPEDARVIDGRGKTLVPGLIDAHTHCWNDALERALVFGVTTEIDMFTAAAFASERRAEQKRGPVFTRADLVSAGTLVTVGGGHGTEYGVPIATFAKGMDAQRFIDDRIAEGSDFIKLVHDDGHSYGLDFPTLDRDDLAALIAAAHRRGKLAVVHALTASAAKEAILAGADGLVHAWSDTVGEPSLYDEIARRNAFVVATLSVLGSLGGETSAALAKRSSLAPYLTRAEIAGLNSRFPGVALNRAALENGEEVVRHLRVRGVRILAGTDAPNPGTAHGASIHGELGLLAGAGMEPIEALRAATSLPAQIFHLSDRGRIAKGKRADLLLVDGDPTSEITATRNIIAVWKAGREVPRMKATAEAAETQRASIAAGVFSDFEDGTRSKLGTEWQISTDQMMGGKSTGELSIASGSGRTGRVLAVHGRIEQGSTWPWSGAMLMLSSRPMAPVDLRPLREISFAIRSDAAVRLFVFAASRGRFPVVHEIPATAGWTTVTLPFSELGLDGSDIQAILISGTRGEYAFELDDVAFH